MDPITQASSERPLSAPGMGGDLFLTWASLGWVLAGRDFFKFSSCGDVFPAISQQVKTRAPMVLKLPGTLGFPLFSSMNSLSLSSARTAVDFMAPY